MTEGELMELINGCPDFAEYGFHICGDKNPDCPIKSGKQVSQTSSYEEQWQKSVDSGKVRMLRIVPEPKGTH